MKPMTRRKWLGMAMLGVLLSSCMTSSAKPKLLLSEVLAMLPTLSTEAQVVAQIRAPEEVNHFNPGHVSDGYPLNRRKREAWTEDQIFVPPTLIANLPLGTKFLSYSFSYHPSRTGGEALVYVDDHGRVLGWSYSKTLSGLENKAVLKEL